MQSNLVPRIGKKMLPPKLRDALRGMHNAALRLALSGVGRRVLKEKLTYLSPQKMRTLERCIRRVEQEKIPGDFVECGVALGGSAILLASHLSGGRRFHGYDVFGMIPPPSQGDERDAHERYEVIRSGASAGIDGQQYYGYVPDLLAVVTKNFQKFGLEVDGERVALHRGLFEDTLKLDSERAVALAHIDCDWFEPVQFCLERIYERLAIGGFIVLDDYNDYVGCRKAVDAFLAEKPDMVLLGTRGNAALQRARAA